MKSTCKDKIVVRGEFVQTFVEVALVDQAAGFVDYDQGIYDPKREKGVRLLYRMEREREGRERT